MSTSSQILGQIVSGTRSLNAEISSLQPSTPIYLYEIDLKEIYPQIASISQSGQPLSSGILRVYNDYNLFNLTDNNYRYGTVLWQNNYYYPFPIMTEGFDLNSAGTLPTPTVTIANTSPDTSTNSFYKYVRMQVQSLGDVVGAKFTRIRSFLKYLHGQNFSGGRNPYNNDPSIYEVELPRDIYYVERKVTENKYKIEYSLASILDVENLSLPSRTVLATKCPFQYRGEGCLYEYNKRVTPAHSGIYGEVVSPGINITLPLEAPPVATDNDELFLGTIFTGAADQQRFSGISYDLVGAGNYGNTNGWTFTNYTLNAGTAAQCAAALTDNSTATTAITQLAGQSIVQLALNTGAEITRISLNSRNTITNNYQIQFSVGNGTWRTVKDVSGYVLNWNLNGQAAGTYNISFPSHGIHTGWRLISSNTTAGTQLSELDFSGQYRIADKGLWQTGIAYQRGDFIYLEKSNIKYYYVSLTGHTGTVFNSPPNRLYWGSDNCSKSTYACRLRWLKNPYFRPVFWPVTRGGWDYNSFISRYLVTGTAYNFAPTLAGGYFDSFTATAGISTSTFVDNRRRFVKSAADGFNHQVYFNGALNSNTNSGLYAEGRAGAVLNNIFAFGLSTTPTTNASWTNLNFGWYFSNGTLQIIQSGATIVANAGSYDTNTILKVEASGTVVRYYINNSLYRTAGIPAATTFYLDSSFNNNGTIADLYWGIPGLSGYVGNLRNAQIPSWYNQDQSLWPRRSDCHDPMSYYAHGLPKDYTGEYLNGFLPFGGFPGVEKTK